MLSAQSTWRRWKGEEDVDAHFSLALHLKPNISSFGDVLDIFENSFNGSEKGYSVASAAGEQHTNNHMKFREDK
ncbi:hypothetical protein N7445_008337 [Penicillium cf. griseofulvum]|nr:hypothetical protein N7445_008337 [Penicillium cf. griseofulvum]